MSYLSTPFLMDMIMISVGSKPYETSFWIIEDKFDEKDAHKKWAKAKRAQIELLYALALVKKGSVHPFGEVIHCCNIYFKALTGHNITKDLHCYSVCVTKSSTYDIQV